MSKNNTKKKTYIAPAIQVIELEPSSMIALSPGDTLPGTGVGGDSDGGMSGDANRHRGEWGNLWK